MCGHSGTGTITTSTGKHDHCQCQHELAYCQVCNVVYCKKCNREWHQDTNVPYTGYMSGTINWGNCTHTDGATITLT